ncbi:type II toxin-antitoxin system PemK/MazF family toxin [Mycobacterium sp.]|uniref:type II toxin-antitoxin system PemK/MazF family toxin n=1 Tax=Mycobacterium sp. TaxID=1785 RepID=UPI003A8C7417
MAPGNRASGRSQGNTSGWRTFQRFAENLLNEAPRAVRRLQDTHEALRVIQQAVKITADLMMGVPAAPAGIGGGRPVTRTSFPTSQRARKVEYAPDLDGRADPGEIVWTWVVYEDDPTRGKDRPVLVVGRDRDVLLGLMLSSREHHAGERDWAGIGTGAWDYEGRQSWVRLDRVLNVPEEGIRREGAILDRRTFDAVAARLRTEYAWR